MLCNVVESGVDAGSVARAQINHWEKRQKLLKAGHHDVGVASSRTMQVLGILNRSD